MGPVEAAVTLLASLGFPELLRAIMFALIHGKPAFLRCGRFSGRIQLFGREFGLNKPEFRSRPGETRQGFTGVFYWVFATHRLL
jgi:hypothetical protein